MGTVRQEIVEIISYRYSFLTLVLVLIVAVALLVLAHVLLLVRLQEMQELLLPVLVVIGVLVPFIQAMRY